MKPNHRIYAKIGLIGYSLLVNPSNRARSVLFRQYQQPLTINVLIEPFCSIRLLGLKFFAALTDIDTYINTLGIVSLPEKRIELK